MEHKPVKSSNIESAAYDEATRTLEVRFRGNPSTYSYSDVPPEIHAKLTDPKSDSAGRFFHSSVRGKFAHKKV